jgi:hypothetical protein
MPSSSSLSSTIEVTFPIPLKQVTCDYGTAISPAEQSLFKIFITRCILTLQPLLSPRLLLLSMPLRLQLLLKIPRPIKNPHRPRPTNQTIRSLLVPLDRTCHTVIVSTLCHHRILIILPTNQTYKRDIPHFVIGIRVVGFFNNLGFFLLFDFPISVDLPACFVVASVVEEFTVIPKAAVSSQFVIFADI